MTVDRLVWQGKEALLFLKKRSKKLFSIWGAGVFTGKDPDDRSFFCFFFVHKKEGSSCRAKPPNRSWNQRAAVSHKNGLRCS
jgi:hypothetical protein